MRPSISYLAPVKPRFNEKKATQLAAEVLRLAGGTYEYISLVKLIYFIDRAALDRRGFAVSTDTYYCLPHGPIVSEILDLAKDRCSREEGFWSQHIRRKDKYFVELIADREVGTDELSEFEIDLIGEIFSEHGGKKWRQLVKESHELPEYSAPTADQLGENRSRLYVDQILVAMNKSPEEIEQARLALEEQALLDSVR